MAAQPSYNVSAVPIKFLRNSLSQVTEGDNKMSSAVDSMPDASRLYIGEGVTIKGEISVPDTLVVCGSVEGDVSVGNLVVGETGVIKGRIIVAQNAEISGKVFEKLDVKCLMILRSTSRVDGNVSYGMLQIEQGATIAGGISSSEYRPEQKPAKSEQPVRQEQKPLQSPLGNGARLGKQPDLSVGFGRGNEPGAATGAVDQATLIYSETSADAEFNSASVSIRRCRAKTPAPRCRNARRLS